MTGHDGLTWYGLVTTLLLSALDRLRTSLSDVFAWTSSISCEKQHVLELQQAANWNDWCEAARALDKQKDALTWILNPIDKHYDWTHVRERRKALEQHRHDRNYVQIGGVLRHSLMRHIYGITNLALYRKTYAVTKEEIHMYVDETVASIKAVTRSPTALATKDGRFTAQDKRTLLHDLRLTYGKTALVLQGGSIFGICHLGVVRALNEQGILPSVIVGTATGALMAALVGSKTQQELPDFVSGDSLDLSAFAARSHPAEKHTKWYKTLPRFLWPLGRACNWTQVMLGRIRRLAAASFLLDPDALAQCVEDNVGDMTFEEAYRKTGRILNIIISSPNEDVPSLMNHLTAPNYLIRSAAMASHATDVAQTQLSALRLLRKDMCGQVQEKHVEVPKGWHKHRRLCSRIERNSQFRRLRQQFNVEHYIVSQARPYIAPFTLPSLPYRRGQRQGRWWVRSLLGLLIRQLLNFLDIVNALPATIHRVLSDETFKSGNHITLVAEVAITDWSSLLQNPKRENFDTWLLRGERAVWPSLCALKVRMAGEMTLQECWDELHQRPAMADQQATAPRTGADTSTEGQVPDSIDHVRDNEERLLRDMQRGVVGFVPGITGMDHIRGTNANAPSDNG